MSRPLGASARRLRHDPYGCAMILGSLSRASRTAKRRQEGREAGSATVRTAAFLLVFVLFSVTLLHGAAFMQARHRAQAAADLGAIAAAQAVALGSAKEAACGEAGRVAKANGASLASCTIAGARATVQATAPGPSILPDPQARGLAGPAEE